MTEQDKDALIEKLLAALEFYGNKETYGMDGFSGISRSTGHECYDVVCFDFDRNLEPRKDYAGSLARKTMALPEVAAWREGRK